MLAELQTTPLTNYAVTRNENGRSKSKRSIETRTQTLWDWYLVLASELFIGAHSLEQVIMTCNNFFTQYQGHHFYRMSPESLESNKVDCTSAAAICAIYWWLTRNVSPVFFVEKEPRKDGIPLPSKYLSPKWRHTVVGLPKDVTVSSQRVVDAYGEFGEGKEVTDVIFLEYTDTNGFRFAKPHRAQPARVYEGLDSFLASQVSRYQTKTEKKPIHNHLLNNEEINPFEVVSGSVVDTDHLPERVSALIRMGLGVEGDYNEVEFLYSGMLGMNNYKSPEPFGVSPTVVKNKKSGETITLLHLK